MMARWIWIIVCLGTFAACSSGPKKPVPMPMGKVNVMEGSGFFTQEGDCFAPAWSPSGRKIVAICGQRVRHAHPQIYEFDPAGGKERRVSWQDGEITEVTWIDENNLLFTSSTDEIKERLFDPEREKGQLPTEIYRSDLYGQDIVRLTDNPGFDGDISILPGRKSFLSLSYSKKEWHMQRMDLDVRKSHAALEKPATPRRFPIMLADRSSAWVEFGKPGDGDRLVWMNKQKRTIHRAESIQGLRLSPDFKNFVFSEKISPTGPWKIFRFDPNPLCLRLLIESATIPIQDPDLDFSGRRLLYSQGESPLRRLILKDLPNEDGPCLPFESPDKIAP